MWRVIVGGVAEDVASFHDAWTLATEGGHAALSGNAECYPGDYISVKRV
jgi:hypothetical protein